MTHIEIQKAIRKEKPIAMLNAVTKDGISYSCAAGGEFANFLIPFNDIHDGKFGPHMQAQYLIRWLQKEEK